MNEVPSSINTNPHQGLQEQGEKLPPPHYVSLPANASILRLPVVMVDETGAGILFEGNAGRPSITIFRPDRMASAYVGPYRQEAPTSDAPPAESAHHQMYLRLFNCSGRVAVELGVVEDEHGTGLVQVTDGTGQRAAALEVHDRSGAVGVCANGRNTAEKLAVEMKATPHGGHLSFHEPGGAETHLGFWGKGGDDE